MKPARAGTQSIERVVDILRYLAAGDEAGVRIADIVVYLKLEPGTAHRILKALTAAELVSRNAESHRYSLGPLTYELGLVAKPHGDFAAVCAASVLRIAERTGDVAMLTLRSGLDSICLDRQEGSAPIRTLTSRVGVRRPLGVGAGSLAILSALPVATTEQVIQLNRTRYGQFNGLTADVLRKMVSKTRAIGYAYTHGEMYADVGGIGVIIRDANGAPIAALNMATTVSRLPMPRVRQIVRDLRKEVLLIERKLR